MGNTILSKKSAKWSAKEAMANKKPGKCPVCEAVYSYINSGQKVFSGSLADNSSAFFLASP